MTFPYAASAIPASVPERQDAHHVKKMRLHALDMLRGLCALGVAAYHMRLWSDIALPPAGVALLQLFGTYGVSIFFVLSGYSLAHAYRADFAQGVHAQGLGEYWRRRFARLAPLFAIVSILSLGGKALTSGRLGEPFHLLANVSLLFGFADPAATPVIGGWSIGVEVVFYLVFPMLLLMPRAWTALSAVLLATIVAIDVGHFDTLANAWQVYVRPSNHWIFFCGGVLMQSSIQASRRMGRGVLLAALCGLVAIAFVAGLQASELQVVTGWRRAVLVPCSLGVVWLVAAIQTSRGWTTRLCTLAGGLSYPLYLIHPLLYFGLRGRLPVTSGATWMALVAAAVVLALLADRLLDAPMQRWLKRRGW